MIKPASDIFQAFENLNVLIIGDVMIDRYLTGNIDRISPEAPVPVVHLQTRDNRLGGAANVALNIKAMGANPILCSVIGKDENAELFLSLLPDNELVTKGIVQSNTRCTTVKTRVIAANQQILRVDTEDTHDLNNKEQNKLLDCIKNILTTQKIDVILFQDYNKGVLCQELIREVILEAYKREIITVVDPKLKNFLSYRKATLFKPNLKEVKEGLPIKVEATTESLLEASQYIRQELNNQYTMITLGDKGMFIDDGTHSRIISTQPRDIADVCGAGDTVISLAALGLALGLDIENIAHLANLAGGIVCEQVGVVPIDVAQLEEEYKRLLVTMPVYRQGRNDEQVNDER